MENGCNGGVAESHLAGHLQAAQRDSDAEREWIYASTEIGADTNEDWIAGLRSRESETRSAVTKTSSDAPEGNDEEMGDVAESAFRSGGCWTSCQQQTGRARDASHGTAGSDQHTSGKGLLSALQAKHWRSAVSQMSKSCWPSRRQQRQTAAAKLTDEGVQRSPVQWPARLEATLPDHLAEDFRR